MRCVRHRDALHARVLPSNAVVEPFAAFELLPQRFRGHEEALLLVRASHTDQLCRNVGKGASFPEFDEQFRREIVDTRPATKSVMTAPPLTRNPLLGRHFRPPLAPNGLGGIAAVLSFTVALGPALIAIAAPRFEAVSDAAEDTVEYDEAIVTWAPLTLLGLALWCFTLLLAGVLFLCWLWQARINAERMDPSAQRLGRGWTIGSWFLHLGHLVLPAIVVGDVHRAAHTPTHTDFGRAGYHPLVVCWWLSWLTTWVWSETEFWWATTVFFTLTAALFTLLIRQVDSAQRAEAERRVPTFGQRTIPRITLPVREPTGHRHRAGRAADRPARGGGVDRLRKPKSVRG